MADSSVYHFLLGHHYLAPALASWAEWSTPPALPFYPAGLKDALAGVLLTDDIEPRPVVLLRGMPGSARAHAVSGIFASENRQTLQVDIDKCAESDDDALLLHLTCLMREARMRGAGMVIRNLQTRVEKSTSLLERLSEQLNQPGLRVVCLIEPYAPPLWLKKRPPCRQRCRCCRRRKKRTCSGIACRNDVRRIWTLSVSASVTPLPRKVCR